MGTSKLNIQSVCSYFHIACTLFLFSTIPFYYSMFTQYGLILFFSSFAIDYVASQRWKQGFKFDLSKVISLCLMLLFVLLFIFGVFEKDPTYLSTFYEYRSALLGFGIVGMMGVSDKFKVRYFAYISILSIIVFICLLISKIPNYFYNLESITQQLQSLRYLRLTYISSHMQINIFLCVGMILFAKVFDMSSSKCEKIFVTLMVLTYYSLVMLSEGRIGILNANLVLFSFLLHFTIKNRKILMPLIILLGVIVLLGLYILDTDNAFKKYLNHLDKPNSREYVWQEGVNIIKESPLIGVGASTNAMRVKERLLANEELAKIEEFLLENIKDGKVYSMHTHNQIMQSWQEYGIIGLFAILGLFISMFLLCRNSFPMLLILSVIFIQLITDVIDGGIGNLGFSMYVFLLLALYYSNQVGKEKVSSSNRVLSSPSDT